jgi:predicted helicase
LRKARGVWYTPQPVVNFIVLAVDDILKTEFNMPQGLADTSKTKIKINHQGKQIEQEVHKVQILDPATGTGTFLAEVVKHIHKKFEGQQGIWSNYVETHLLPRLNGFELLMASYAMAHLKLDLLLTETGYKPTTNQRFRVYLTNSLEESHPETGTLFANWLSTEANEANYIKRDTPVMCVIGNPPYSGISSNNGEWISKLIEDYKYVDGVHFNERKHWLNDDYVKFIRYGQFFIEKNGSGVLAFINPHGFLDNPTFRGMRWNLLKTYDKIYTIDLHGNAKKKEKALDGSLDVNVFDIEQGVSINIFIKTGKKKNNELGKVFHYDLLGKRELKYDFLLDKSLNSVDFKELKPEKPFLLFVDRNSKGIIEYNKGFAVNEIFKINSVGSVSANDGLNISFTEEEQKNKISDLLLMEEHLWRIKYKRPKDARDWTYLTALNDASKNNENSNFIKTSYRPFDIRWSLYTGNSRGLYSSPQPKVMRHLLKQNNLGLVIGRQGQAVGSMPWNLSFVTDTITDFNMYYRGGGMLFPLYLYPETNTQQTIGQSTERQPNLNTEIVKQIADKLGLTFTNEKETTKDSFAPIDILDYIYAVLHSPTYREKNKEFLKIDFPRVPYPKDKESFWQLVNFGSQIRQIHLLESPIVEKYITQYPVDGDNIVTKPKYQGGKVYINDTQYFNNVPQTAWEFYIGGYQPAQKWLKDRKDRKLEFDDILHYQKIIVALTETDRLMKEINKIDIE